MKRKFPVEIGYRMVDELYRLFPNKSDRWIARTVGCSTTMIQAWRSGVTPSAGYIARLIHLGGDEQFVLIGGSRNGR